MRRRTRAPPATPRPSTPARTPCRADADRRRASRARAARTPAAVRRAGASSSSPARAAPPPITTSSGIERVDRVGDPDPDPLAPLLDHPPRVGIAVVGGLHRLARRSARSPAASLRPSDESGCALRVGDHQPVECMARSLGLERPGLRRIAPPAGCRRSSPCRQSCARARRRRRSRPGRSAAEHESAADAGTDRQHHQVTRDHSQLVSRAPRPAPRRSRRCRRTPARRGGRRAPRAAARRAAGCWPTRRPAPFENSTIDGTPIPTPSKFARRQSETPATSCSISAVGVRRIGRDDRRVGQRVTVEASERDFRAAEVDADDIGHDA